MTRRPAMLCAFAFLVACVPSAALGRVIPEVGSNRATPVSNGYARLDRVIDTESSGITRPSAVAWASSLQRLVIADAAHPERSALAPLIGDASAGIAIPGAADRVAMAYDPAEGRLLTLDRAGTTLRSALLTGAQAGRWTSDLVDLGTLGPIQVDGVAAARGGLWVLDGHAAALYRLSTAGASFGASTAQRTAIGFVGSGARGLAVDPRSGHLFVLAAAGTRLWELDPAGTPLVVRSLSGVGLSDPRGIVIAPSGDPTDAPSQTSLYIADAGATVNGQPAGAGVYEVSLTAPQLAASLAGATSETATVVQTIDTSQWNPASPDPDGFDYIPSMDRLLVSDSEVDETTGAGWHGVNVWFATRQGGVPDSDHHMNTELASPSDKEPAAAAYDEVRNEIYIGKDGSNSAVWVYGPGNDGVFGTSDDQQLRYFTTYTHGVSDGEGLAFGNGNLYVADGTGKEVWTVSPGNDGVVGTGDDTYSHFDVLSLGQNNPEGIDVDASTGNLWVVSNDTSSGVLEVTTDGVPVSTIARSQIPALHPGGLAIAPSSVDDTTPNVWIADRGIDNNTQSNENDGKLFELSVTAGPPPPPPGGNVIVNGDFETANGQGQPNSWTLDPRFTQSSAVVHGGTYAGRHQATDNSGYTITQNAPAVAGTAYNFVGWVNVPATTDAFKLVLKVQWRNASGKSIGTVTVGKITKSTAGWVALNGAMTAPTGAVTARVMMVVSSLNATIYVDDFELASSP